MSTLSMAQLGPVDPLTDLSRALFPVGMIADRLFPPMIVNAETGQVTVWDDTNMMVPSDAKRAVGAPTPMGKDPIPTYMTYTCEHYSKALSLVPRELKRVASPQGIGGERLKFAKTKKITNQLKLIREQDLATKLTTDANYETSYSGDATSVWTGDASTPITDIKAAVKQLEDNGVFPNVIAMDIAVWRALETHSALLNYLKYTKGGKVTPEGFTTIFGLTPIIAYARYNNAGTITPVWGDSCIVAYVEGEGLDINDAESSMTLGRTLLDAPLTVVEMEDRLSDHAPGSVIIEGELGFCHQFIGVDNTTDGDTIAGFHMDNCV